jgi:hypothetical protein
MDGQEARKDLLQRQAEGELLVGSENCEGFDPRRGCPGHEVKQEKKYPIGGYAPGNYTCKCCICSCNFQGDKRAVQCEPCAEKAVGNLKDHDQIIANQMTGMSIEEAIFQTGFTRGHNVGYERMKREAEQGVIHQRKETVEEEWESFWKEIVTNDDGTINIEQVKKELADFSFVMEQVQKVYCHITGSKMSKVMYHADTVIAVADDHFKGELEEAVKEEMGERESFKWLNLATNYTEDWQMMHCRYAIDKYKLDAYLFEEKDGGLQKKGGTGRVGLHEVEYLVESEASATNDSKSKGAATVNAEYVCTFETFAQWVNHAASWIGGHRKGTLICIDKAGNLCLIGEDFMAARDFKLFPVRAYRMKKTIEAV